MHNFDPKESRILVVDDNPTNLLLLKRVFQHAGYSQVRGVQEPTEVVDMVLDWNPDLIILDLHMPGMTGFEVLEQLREGQDEDEFLPILIFTADVTPDAKRRALELGASDFLTKPGDATEILLRAGNFLKMRFLYGALAENNHLLEAKVAERTKELEAAQLEIVDRLAMASEYRDDDTWHH
ncbi:MAG TPA: response regulator, partial [Fimbriimonadaceae bacterium]|nr:response regulator [Fimbriimonadaceae bacterium]